MEMYLKHLPGAEAEPDDDEPIMTSSPSAPRRKSQQPRPPTDRTRFLREDRPRSAPVRPASTSTLHQRLDSIGASTLDFATDMARIVAQCEKEDFAAPAASASKDGTRPASAPKSAKPPPGPSPARPQSAATEFHRMALQKLERGDVTEADVLSSLSMLRMRRFSSSSGQDCLMSSASAGSRPSSASSVISKPSWIAVSAEGEWLPPPPQSPASKFEKEYQAHQAEHEKSYKASEKDVERLFKQNPKRDEWQTKQLDSIDKARSASQVGHGTVKLEVLLGRLYDQALLKATKKKAAEKEKSAKIASDESTKLSAERLEEVARRLSEEHVRRKADEINRLKKFYQPAKSTPTIDPKSRRSKRPGWEVESCGGDKLTAAEQAALSSWLTTSSESHRKQTLERVIRDMNVNIPKPPAPISAEGVATLVNRLSPTKARGASSKPPVAKRVY